MAYVLLKKERKKTMNKNYCWHCYPNHNVRPVRKKIFLGATSAYQDDTHTLVMSLPAMLFLRYSQWRISLQNTPRGYSLQKRLIPESYNFTQLSDSLLEGTLWVSYFYQMRACANPESQSQWRHVILCRWNLWGDWSKQKFIIIPNIMVHEIYSSQCVLGMVKESYPLWKTLHNSMWHNLICFF